MRNIAVGLISAFFAANLGWPYIFFYWDAAFLKVGEAGGGRMSGGEHMEGEECMGTNVLPLQDHCAPIESHITRNTAQKSIRWFWSLFALDQYEIVSVIGLLLCCSCSEQKWRCFLLLCCWWRWWRRRRLCDVNCDDGIYELSTALLLQEHYNCTSPMTVELVSLWTETVWQVIHGHCHQPFSTHRELHLYRHLLIFLQYFTDKYFV